MSENLLILVGLIMGISQYCKEHFLPFTIGKYTFDKKFLPVLNIVLAFSLLWIFVEDLTVRQYIIQALIIGTSGTGSFSTGKNTKQGVEYIDAKG